MKTTASRTLIALAVSALAAAALTAAATGCAQPPPGCVVSTSVPFALPYAAQYKQTSADDGSACSGFKGDQIGMSPYTAANKDRTAPDLSKVSMGMRTLRLGTLAANAEANGVKDSTDGDSPTAFGPFKSAFPDANDICTPTLDPAKQVLAEVPGSDSGTPDDTSDDVPTQPATDLEEDWSDVQVYVTAAVAGTQVSGHYTYKDNSEGCQAEYDVLAVFPAVACGDTDEDGNVTPNIDFCSPVAIPDKGIVVGSGINPDFPTKCEDLGDAGAPNFMCVIDAAPGTKLPILKKGAAGG